MKELHKKCSVELHSTVNEEKSSVVERWNRTIKRIMWKYFTANNTMKYIDVLPEIIQKYNNTYHRSIKRTSAFARDPSSYQHVFEALYGKIQTITPPKYKVGDRVRTVKKKKTFEKGFTPNWTEELVTIIKVKYTKPVTYNIEDTRGEDILSCSSAALQRCSKLSKRYIEWKKC